MSEDRCDVFVIGAGQAAEQLASECQGEGMRVIVAERKNPGGSCVNFGCTPTKAAIESAKLAFQAKRAREFGVNVSSVEVDYAEVLRLARDLAHESRDGVAKRLSTPPHHLIRGHAKLAGMRGGEILVEVNGVVYAAKHVMVNVGTRSQIPPIPGLDQVDIFNAENWLERPKLPRRLAFLGSGTIAIEMTQFYRRMGVEELVSFDPSAQILGREDSDVAGAVQKILEDEGVTFRLNTRVERIARVGDEIHLEWKDGHHVADALFVATGRKPNTDDLGLETVDLKADEHGVIAVDEHLRTAIPNLFVAGDARGGPMFTHTSWDDARIVADAILGRGGRTTHRVVPYAVFTDPPLGRVGMTETEANKAGKGFKTLKFEMARNGHASEARETKGFVKLLVEEGTEKILGAAVLGASGGDLVHLYSLMMAADLPANVLRDAVIAHPTYAEAIQNVLL